MADRLLLVIVLVLGAVASAAQDRRAPESMVLLEDAAEAYRKGDFDAARKRLAQLSVPQRKAAAEALIDRERTRAKRGLASAASGAKVLRAAAAIEMDAAAEPLRSFLFGGTVAVRTRIGIARELFDAAAELDGSAERVFERWLTAIGTDLMARGSFNLAEGLLTPECERRPEYAPLLLTCGIARETHSILSDDTAKAVRQSRGPSMLLSQSRAARSASLKAARQLLERAAALAPNDAEAPMRLGLVLIHTRNIREAIGVLEALTARRDLPVRNRYLANLFLGHAYQREQRFEDAQRAFDAALAAADVQSALLALSHNAQLQGRSADAAALAERATTATLKPDPWWQYHFGQYWLLPGLFDALRREAQQ